MREIARSTALLFAGLLLAGPAFACSGPGSQASDPATVLRQAGQALAGLHSVTADVKFGPGIAVEGLTLSSATAKIQLPDQSDAVLKVRQGDFLVDLRVVTTGGHTYLQLPFSRFTELTPAQAAEIPGASKLFDRQSGLPAVLSAGTNRRYLGTEQVSGTDCDKVRVTYTAEQVGQLLGGLKPASDVQATFWAGRSDHYLRRAVLSGPLVSAGSDVQVQIDLHDFNKPVAITSPT